MIQTIADKIASGVDWVLGALTTEKGTMFIAMAGLVVGMLALQGWIPTIAGSIALGLLAGQAFRPILQSSNIQTKTVTTEQIVPYNDWPDECYGCGAELGAIRGQLAIHKSEDSDDMKAVGLCEECTRTHSTLLDYSDRVQEMFDHRGNPEEI
jgi:hypothetical protein